MRDPHEHIEELLAGHALRSLDPAEAREAERLLAEHVPACPRCREALDQFQQVAGDLTLAAPPVQPPDLLLGRLRKEIKDRRRAGVVRRPSAWLSAAAAIAVLGLAGWNAILNARVNHDATKQHQLQRATAFLAQPDVKKIALNPERTRHQPVVMGFRRESVIIYGSDVQAPSPGHVYRLWLGRNGRFTRVMDFLPDEGLVVLSFSFPVSRYDEILITEESVSGQRRQPSGTRAWSGHLSAAT